MIELTISDIHEINQERKLEWHGPGNEWSPAEWGNALAGECGELCNVLKKILRESQGINTKQYAPGQLRQMAADEIADVYLYLDIIAEELSIDLYEAIVKKFNEVSERENLPQRIPE